MWSRQANCEYAGGLASKEIENNSVRLPSLSNNKTITVNHCVLLSLLQVQYYYVYNSLLSRLVRNALLILVAEIKKKVNLKTFYRSQ